MKTIALGQHVSALALQILGQFALHANVLGFYLPDASSNLPVVTTKHVSRHSRRCLRGKTDSNWDSLLKARGFEDLHRVSKCRAVLLGHIPQLINGRILGNCFMDHKNTDFVWLLGKLNG